MFFCSPRSVACLSGFASTFQVIVFQVPLLGLHLWPPLKHFRGLPPITNNPKIDMHSQTWGSKTTYLAARRHLFFDVPQPSYAGLRGPIQTYHHFLQIPFITKNDIICPACVAWKCGSHPLILCSSLPLNSGLLLFTLTTV